MLKNKILSAVGASEEPLYSDSVFSTYTYTGNGSTQTIANGIDLAGKGGLVWIKSRGPNTFLHNLYDTPRGVSAGYLRTNGTAAQTGSTDGVAAFNSDGFSLQAVGVANGSGESFVSWTFRKAAKFFDCGTYTGNGVAGRQIPHNLGVAPGFILIKKTSATGEWLVFARADSTNYASAYLTTNALGTVAQSNVASSTVLNIGWLHANWYSGYNDNGATYVWYAFAHDSGADGIIQCGSFTNLNTEQSINLGWEPQFIITKNASSVENWRMFDVMRGMPATGNPQWLRPNTSDTEGTQTYSTGGTRVTATGFTYQDTGAINGNTVIYLAIRRPNKPPTTGTQVYNAIARTGTGAAATVTGVGFAPDLVLARSRNGTSPVYGLNNSPHWVSRLTGNAQTLNSSNTSGENTSGSTGDVTGFDTMDGMRVGVEYNTAINASGLSIINHFFKRAPGVFETLCYTGTGANKTEPHGLSIAPELWLIKRRDATSNWTFGSSLLSATEKIVMPSVNGRVTDSTVWNSTLPSSSVISLGISTDVNTNAGAYVAYLWSSKAGISKVFTYTGNGTTQTVNCGFTTGARFVMIIRATAATAQDIFVWDTSRGIIAGNDPRLSLNTTAAEVTTLDSIDVDTTGFVVNTDASNINVNGAVYIGLAYA